jgi:tRNA U34 5-carboxymethylaminomethyl modifying enzyme MnmG/GidA
MAWRLIKRKDNVNLRFSEYESKIGACEPKRNFNYSVAYRAVAGQRPRKKQRAWPLLCNRRMKTRPFIGNGSLNSPTTLEELFKEVFSVGSVPRLYNEEPRSAQRIIER